MQPDWAFTSNFYVEASGLGIERRFGSGFRKDSRIWVVIFGVQGCGSGHESQIVINICVYM